MSELIREIKWGNIIGSKINPDGWKVYATDFEFIMENPDDYFPIDLTHEWLERFGFHEDEPTLSISLDEPVTKELVFNQYSKLFSIFNSGHHTYLGKIQHVHQLQNLYWCLCGKELELKQ